MREELPAPVLAEDQWAVGERWLMREALLLGKRGRVQGGGEGGSLKAGTLLPCLECFGSYSFPLQRINSAINEMHLPVLEWVIIGSPKVATSATIVVFY